MPNQSTPGHERVTIICATCGAIFSVKHYKATTAKFCSRACQGAPRPIKHGASGRGGRYVPEYGIWAAMLDRCRNPNNPFYPDYGGRGIRVTPAWKDYTVFIRDVGYRPSPDLSLERLDHDGDYEPGNVTWRTSTHQQRNKRDNAHVTVNGETLLRIEWSERTGINHSTIRARLRKGWTPEQAVGIEPPPEPRGQSITAGGVTRRVAEWSAITGIKPDAIRTRLRRLGWSAERAVGLEV